MFDFLKPKTKLPPHEMGRGLALVISERFWPKIKDELEEKTAMLEEIAHSSSRPDHGYPLEQTQP